ncbi:MAG: sulfate transporter CysZ [Gammaproteobacteria bacterium]|nr:sulfate transporter CysZ [Gammaproteobacteria bacterium]
MKRDRPLAAATCLFRGMGLLMRPGIRLYVILPVTINLVIYLGVGWFIGRKALTLTSGMLDYLPEWLQWFDLVIWILFGLVALLITTYTFTLLANLIGAPFNGLLAERVELELTGQKPPDNSDWRTLLRNFGPDILNELRKLLYFASRALLLLLLTLIPLVNLFAAPLWLGFNAWMMGLEYLDYPMANHRLDFRQQRRRHRQTPLSLFGFGAATLLLSLVPVINLLAMPTAVAGATLLWVERLQPDHRGSDQN